MKYILYVFNLTYIIIPFSKQKSERVNLKKKTALTKAKYSRLKTV